MVDFWPVIKKDIVGVYGFGTEIAKITDMVQADDIKIDGEEGIIVDITTTTEHEAEVI